MVNYFTRLLSFYSRAIAFKKFRGEKMLFYVPGVETSFNG